MQLQRKVYCRWDFVRFISERHLQKEDGTFCTLSVTEGGKLELMIFLGKGDDNSSYEVRVYKNEPGDKYVPHECDNVSRYEENDEYATFFFEEYEDACSFTAMIGYLHPEYKKRPVQEIPEKN